jgi:hypothetical protein
MVAGPLATVDCVAAAASSSRKHPCGDERMDSHFELTVLREESEEAALDEFRKDAIEGFSKQPKSLSSKYFYDDAGSGKFPPPRIVGHLIGAVEDNPSPLR